MSSRLKREIAALAFVPLAACAKYPPSPILSGKHPIGSPSTSTDSCSEAALSLYMGEPASSELGAKMLAATQRTMLRWVRAGDMVTMDLRADRLTIYLDAANKVDHASCT